MNAEPNKFTSTEAYSNCMVAWLFIVLKMEHYRLCVPDLLYVFTFFKIRPERLNICWQIDLWLRSLWTGRGVCWQQVLSILRQSYSGILFLFFNVIYATLLHLSPLRFHCVGGCWDRTHDCCDFGICSRNAVTTRLDLIHGSPRSHPRLARSHPRLARSHPHSTRSHPHSARSHPRQG